MDDLARRPGGGDEGSQLDDAPLATHLPRGDATRVMKWWVGNEAGSTWQKMGDTG